MKKSIFLIKITLLLTSTVFAQNVNQFGIDFTGFVKTDVIYDTRQTVNLREGHFLLHPANYRYDVLGNDLNAHPSFNILSIQTRVGAKLSAPKTFEAKTSGFIEAEFFGTSDGDVNGLRLRHAFVKLDWESASLLVGQTWHPMFVTDVFPGVVSFNTGAPFQPFSRNPQIRFTKSIGEFSLMAAAASQRDFQSFGDNAGKPAQSSIYLRNSVIPNFHAQAMLKSKGFVFGVGVDYKILRPRLETDRKFETDESIKSIALHCFGKFKIDDFTFKSQAVYGENLADLMMLGGYGISSIDAATDKAVYSPVSSLTGWLDAAYGKDIEFGLFLGYSKNLGAKEILVSKTFYSRGSDIDFTYRISPRIQYNAGKLRLAAELEHTAASYGTPDEKQKGKVFNTQLVSNTRFLTAVFLFF
ncbi:MAG: hypothetical protein FJ213_10255 [Ignavibacteria bacterium]|nr:hypothetical protein [Ignavibacteria bacterium]